MIVSTEIDPLHSYGPAASRRAVEDSARARRLHASVQSVPQPFSTLGALSVLALGVWLLVSEFALDIPYTATGQATAVRDQGFAVAVLLVGMFLWTHRGSKGAAGVLVVLGVLLVCAGTWAHHQDGREAVNEVVTGALLVLAAVAAAVRRSSDR